MRDLRVAVVAVVLAIAVACGGGATTDDPADPAARAPLVELVRYGGVAGAHDRVTVATSGTATIVLDRAPAPVTRTTTLPADDLAALRRALERVDVTGLQRNYLDRSAVDAFQYDITYQGVTVTADAGVVPASLRPVVDQLTKLLG